jgi:hypothetical protein
MWSSEMAAFIDQKPQTRTASQVRAAFLKCVPPVIAPENDLRVSHHERSITISITWHPDKTRPRENQGDTYLDCAVIGDVFFILHIQLNVAKRGIGLGDSLYKAMIDVASEIGCREIRQAPSGWTGFGETREDYLVRRGWLVDGLEVFIDLSRTGTYRASRRPGK